MIREFRRRVGHPLTVHVGDVIPFEELDSNGDRKMLLNTLFERVHRMSPMSVEETRQRMSELPKWLQA